MSQNTLPDHEPVKGFGTRGSSFVARKEALDFQRGLNGQMHLLYHEFQQLAVARQIHLEQVARTEAEIRATVDELTRRLERAERSWWERRREQLVGAWWWIRGRVGR